MGIIKLNGCLLGEDFELVGAELFVATDDITDGGCTEEVLLLDDVFLHFLGNDHVFVEQDAGNALGSLPCLDQFHIVIVSLAVIFLIFSLKRWQCTP